LINRGILAPPANLSDAKDIDAYNIVNKGSFLNDGVPLIPKDENSIYFNSEKVEELDDEIKG